MSALSTAAILGLAAATGGAQVAGSLIQNHQAGKAIDAQSDATNRAMALQQQQYQQAQQNTQPYMQLGQQGLGALGAMTPNTNTFNPQNFRSGAPVGGMNHGTPQQMPPPNVMSTGQRELPGQPRTDMGSQPFSGGMQANEPMVILQAPDGSTRQFPQSQAQMYIARGAKVVR